MLARHLLLINIAFDWELPMRQRANLYLEVFGNCLVQVRRRCFVRGKTRWQQCVCLLACVCCLRVCVSCRCRPPRVGTRCLSVRQGLVTEVLAFCGAVMRRQERTSELVSQKRLELIELLCNGRGTHAHLFDFTALRFRHRDELETALKTWDSRISYDSKYT